MRLATKIFLSSAASLLVLSTLTLTMVRRRVTEGEEARIRATFRADLTRLWHELAVSSERASTVIAPQVAEMRAFLDDPRDNLLPYARDFRAWLVSEGGRMPRCEAVLIVGADGGTLAYDASPEVAPLALDRAIAPLAAQILETGKHADHVIAIGGRILDVRGMPIRRLEKDDYASAVVLGVLAVDRGWLENLLPRLPGQGYALLSGADPVEGTLPEEAQTSLAARAKAPGAGDFDVLGERYMTWTHEFPSPMTSAARLVLARSLDAAIAPLHALLQELAAAAGVVLLAALVAAWVFARRLAGPLAALARATRRVARGELDFEVAGRERRDEIGELAGAFDGMLAGLRDKERIKDTFGKYLAPAIVEDVLRNPAALALGGERRALTVYFSDIKGFTSLSEAMPPEELVRFLNTYLTAMTEAIGAAGGIVDKYIGDAVVAFWTRPFHAGNHALAACKAALANQRAVKELRATFDREDLRRLEVRIGLSSGEAVVGNIGSNQLRGYTAIGDIVNLGARLEGQNKAYGTGILISEATRKLAGDGIVACELDLIRVVGKHEAVRVFELVGLAGDVDAEEHLAIARFERALARYRGRDFEGAIRTLGEGDAQGVIAEPETTRKRTRRAREAALAERCRGYLAAPPPEGWDGVYEATSK